MPVHAESRVLVTGAAGFLGSRVSSALAQAGANCLATVRPGSRAPSVAEVVEADLSSPADLARLVARAEAVETLVHVAATMPNPALPAEVAAARHDDDARVAGELVAAMPGLRHVVFASSIDVYGAPSTLPLDETSPLSPLTPYARAKVAAERVLAEACAERAITLTVLRLTQIYGPGEPRIKAIPQFITALLEGRTPTLFGDGSDARDYVYVDDAAEAFVAACSEREPGVLVIASGRSTTVSAVLDRLVALDGRGVVPERRERQKPKIDLAFDVSRARHTLGWTARTSLEDGLRAEYEWFATRAGA